MRGTTPDRAYDESENKSRGNCATRICSNPRLNQAVFWHSIVKSILCDSLKWLNRAIPCVLMLSGKNRLARFLSLPHNFERIGIDHSPTLVANVEVGRPCSGGWFNLVAVLVTFKKAATARRVSTHTNPRVMVVGLMRNKFFFHAAILAQLRSQEN